MQLCTGFDTYCGAVKRLLCALAGSCWQRWPNTQVSAGGQLRKASSANFATVASVTSITACFAQTLCRLRVLFWAVHQTLCPQDLFQDPVRVDAADAGCSLRHQDVAAARGDCQSLSVNSKTTGLALFRVWVVSPMVLQHQLNWATTEGAGLRTKYMETAGVMSDLRSERNRFPCSLLPNRFTCCRIVHFFQLVVKQFVSASGLSGIVQGVLSTCFGTLEDVPICCGCLPGCCCWLAVSLLHNITGCSCCQSACCQYFGLTARATCDASAAASSLRLNNPAILAPSNSSSSHLFVWHAFGCVDALCLAHMA